MPLWVTKEIRRLYPDMAVTSTQFTYTQGAVQHSHTKPVGSVSNIKLPIVCGPCNNVWMSQLENRAGRQLVAAIGDTSLTLVPEAQSDIAKWMTLKALTFDLGEPNPMRVVTDDDLHAFYATRSPQPQFVVRLARYGEPHLGHLIFFNRRGYAYPESREDVFAYAQILTLVFGRLVIQSIYVPVANQSLPSVLYRRPIPYDIVIWPGREESIGWPPPLSLDREKIASYSGLPGNPESFAGQPAPRKPKKPEAAPPRKP